jgi:hypothetical protein
VSAVRLRLFTISFLTLFFELALVRFINSTVQVVAYFNNFLILSAFLGIGFGCVLAARGTRDWFAIFPALLAAVVGVALYLDRFDPVGGAGGAVIWLRKSHVAFSLPVWVEIVVVFFANFAFFIPLGNELGKTFARIDDKLAAYSWDLGGSFAGVVVFGVLSYMQTPPVVWFTIGAALTALLMLGRGVMKAGIAVVLLILGVWLSTRTSPGLWSPYYKISVKPYITRQHDYLGFAISVDRLRIQDALHFSPALLRSPLAGWLPYYRLPYELRRPDRVLILGGGSGNDATIALAAGAREVTVVEIDPVIVALGSAMHPHRPYLDPRVKVVNDDARAFLRQTSGTYDTIVMNALDSHHQLPGLSTLRLESFIYTADAFRDVRRHMDAGSMFVVHLSSSRPWMGERLYWSLADAFGREPALLTTAGSPFQSIAFAYAPADVLARARRRGSPLLAVDPAPFRAKPQTTRATDDWPQLYLRDRAIPAIYLVVLALILVITAAAFRTVGRLRTREDVHLFLLGAGFMLLETRSITNASLLFGATWLVNAIVISGILAVVFLGNLLVMRGVRLPRRVSYGVLFALLIIGFAVPLHWILIFPFAGRVLVASLWLAAPIIFTSMIFSEAFERSGDTAAAFGANLLGVVIGGILEYSSMVVGLNALYLLALALYVAAATADRAFARQ